MTSLLSHSRSLALPSQLAVLALAVGGAAAASGFLWGPSSHGLAGALLAVALAWASFVDIDRLILPDAITFSLIVTGVILQVFAGPEAEIASIIGAALGYGSIALAAIAYRKARGRAGLGLGDAKLFSAGGAWLGWAELPIILLVASVAALVLVIARSLVRRELDLRARMPFGPFLAAAIWAVWLLKPWPVTGFGAL